MGGEKAINVRGRGGVDGFGLITERVTLQSSSCRQLFIFALLTVLYKMITALAIVFL